MRRQTGFTLIELALAIMVIGILLAVTDVGQVFRVNRRAYAAHQAWINKNIAATLTTYAKTFSATGRLPAPYTGGGYFSTVLNPTNTNLSSLFTAANVAPSEINGDGTIANAVRVYQSVTLTQTKPLDFQSGPAVTLTYDYAELHMTACLYANACNATPVAGVSGQLTAANYTTWTTTGTDLAPEFFSTLPLQVQMLTLTNSRLNDLRDRVTTYINVLTLAASAGATTNFYPTPTGGGAPNLSGANAATNQGCWDGWYNLAATNVNVLAQLGLTQAQFGQTQWGGEIDYCRDYDPALRGAGSMPHYGAIRFHQSVSTAAAPDTTAALTSANNVYLTF